MVSVLAAAAPCAPRPAVHGEVPDAEWIMQHVAWLASPERRGRRAGTADEQATAQWLAARFAELPRAGGRRRHLAPESAAGPRRAATTTNIVAWLPPRGERASWVMLGAHLDHLGADVEGFFPGADDNASGVAAVIGVAAALATSDRRTDGVLFVGFGGEEVGLVGSRWLASHPPRPLATCRAMVNLDMVGRSPFLGATEYGLIKRVAGIQDGPAVGVLDHAHGSPLLAIARRACADAGIRMYAAEDFSFAESRIRAFAGQRSDDSSFAATGVPTRFFSTSLQDDYHTRTDTIDKLDAAALRIIARAVLRVIEEIVAGAATAHD